MRIILISLFLILTIANLVAGDSIGLPTSSTCKVMSKIFLENFNSNVRGLSDSYTLLNIYFTKNHSLNAVREQYIQSFLDIKISVEEIEFLLNALPPEVTEKNVELVKSYIMFSRVRQSKSRQKIYRKTAELFGPVKGRGRIVKKFYHYIDLTNKYENKLTRKFESSVSIQDKKTFVKNVKKQTKTYEELLYSCRWNSKNMLKRNKRLIYTLTGSGIASATITYSYVNWDKEKDPRKNPQWLGDLVYTQLVSMLWGLFNNYMIYSNFNFHPWRQKLPLSYLTIGMEDILSSQGYEKLFGKRKSKKQLEKYFSSIIDDPKKLQAVEHVFKGVDLGMIVKENSEKIMSLIKTKNGKTVLWHYKKGLPVNFEKDIDLETTQANLLHQEAMKTSDDYQLIDTGSIGWDRYVFHRGFDLVIAPASVIITSKIQRAICMNQDKLVNTDILTAASFISYRLITDALYYSSRRKVINQ